MPTPVCRDTEPADLVREAEVVQQFMAEYAVPDVVDYVEFAGRPVEAIDTDIVQEGAGPDQVAVDIETGGTVARRPGRPGRSGPTPTRRLRAWARHRGAAGGSRGRWGAASGGEVVLEDGGDAVDQSRDVGGGDGLELDQVAGQRQRRSAGSRPGRRGGGRRGRPRACETGSMIIWVMPSRISRATSSLVTTLRKHGLHPLLSLGRLPDAEEDGDDAPAELVARAVEDASRPPGAGRPGAPSPR